MSEALDLRMPDMRPEGGVWVRRRKGGKSRGWTREPFKALGPWLELRGELGMESRPAGLLLVQRDTGRAELCAHMCPRLRTKQGLSKLADAHTLRAYPPAGGVSRGRGGEAEPAAARPRDAGVDLRVLAEDRGDRGRGGCSCARPVGAYGVAAPFGRFSSTPKGERWGPVLLSRSDEPDPSAPRVFSSGPIRCRIGCSVGTCPVVKK